MFIRKKRVKASLSDQFLKNMEENDFVDYNINESNLREELQKKVREGKLF